MHALCLAVAVSTAQRGTLHVILTEELGAASTLSAADQKRLAQVPRLPSDLIEEVNPGSSNRRAITAAVTAQMTSLDANIAQTGLCFSIPGDFARIAQQWGRGAGGRWGGIASSSMG